MSRRANPPAALTHRVGHGHRLLQRSCSTAARTTRVMDKPTACAMAPTKMDRMASMTFFTTLGLIYVRGNSA